MKKLDFHAQNKIAYPYIIGRGGISQLSEIIRERFTEPPRIVVISDDIVAPKHCKKIISALQDATLDEVSEVIIPAGESSKSFAMAEQLIDRLLEKKVDRRALIVALGGGVISDTVGFVSSIYMRGIAYLNVPTSLMAQVDASIGGKVAVNHETCKNLIGHFWHPQAVVVDPELLCTLPANEIRNGLAEIVKVALIYSAEFFEILEAASSRLVNEIGRIDKHDTIITNAINAKLNLLASDPFEQGDLRRTLNFGHTFAHPLEVSERFQLRHGFAVSVGMSIATMIAVERGMFPPAQGDRVFEILRAIGLPTCGPPLDPAVVWDNLKVMRSIRANRLHFVVPVAPGKADYIEDLSKNEFISTYNQLRAEFASTDARTSQP